MKKEEVKEEAEEEVSFWPTFHFRLKTEIWRLQTD